MAVMRGRAAYERVCGAPGRCHFERYAAATRTMMRFNVYVTFVVALLRDAYVYVAASRRVYALLLPRFVSCVFYF